MPPKHLVVGFTLSVAVGEPGALRFFEPGGLLRFELLQRFLVDAVEFPIGLFPFVVHAVLHVFGRDSVFALGGDEIWHKEQKQQCRVFHGCSRVVRRESVYLARDGDSGLSQDVGDLRFAEAGGVVIKRDLIFLLVHVDAAQAVGVGKFAQALQLLSG